MLTLRQFEKSDRVGTPPRMSSQIDGSSSERNCASDEAARRNITVMFTDLEGFTPLAEQLGEEAVFELIREITGEQSAAIEAEGGALQDFAGDGLMAVFGAPVALEDAALRACRAAIDIQGRVRRKQTYFEAKFGIEPRLRIARNQRFSHPHDRR